VSELEDAKAMRERAEAWKVRAIAFSYVMLGVLYATGAWFMYRVGNLLYEELSKW